MKKHVLLLSALIVGVAQAGSSFDKYSELMDVSRDQKRSWFTFMGQEAQERAELLRKQHDDWFSLKKTEASEFRTAPLGTEAEKDAFVAKAFDKALSLREKHLAQWKEHCDARRTKAEALYKKDVAALARLRGSEETGSTEEQPAAPAPKRAKHMDKHHGGKKHHATHKA